MVEQSISAADSQAEQTQSQNPNGVLQSMNAWKEGVRGHFQEMLPPWVRDHSTQISNACMMVFTGTMLASVLHGKKIGGQMYDKQLEILQQSGLEGDALSQKVAELQQQQVMKQPKLHMWRLAYLGTAIASFGTGMVFKEKPQTEEDRKKYDAMSKPEYFTTRLKESFDPTHHARQTVSALGLASGGLAIISSLTQPGGVHRSEMMAAGTLLSGFSALMFMKDSDNAYQTFGAIWWTRLPLIMTGTYESVYSYPKFKHPLTSEMQQLPNRRMDIAYPIGQWGNFATSVFAFLAGSSKGEKKSEPAGQQANEGKPDNQVQQVSMQQHLTTPNSPQHHI